jgi:addiction module RelE/StbE family toxin
VNRELIRTNAFVRATRRHLKKRPGDAADFEAALTMLAEDAFHPRLKTHKLKGELSGVWACGVGYDLRILFEFVEQQGSEAVLLLSMGTHDEVY